MTHSIACPRCHRAFDALPAYDEVHRQKGNSHPCKGHPILAIGLPWTDALTQNQLRRMHHQAEAKAKRLLSEPARWAIRAARLETIEHPVRVVLHWRTADHRVRDADGIAPSLKIAIDALVREHVIPQDDYLFVPFSGQRIHPPRTGMPPAMWVEITSMEEE